MSKALQKWLFENVHLSLPSTIPHHFRPVLLIHSGTTSGRTVVEVRKLLTVELARLTARPLPRIASPIGAARKLAPLLQGICEDSSCTA